jgi:DNA-binding transcriptional ArsR family regulator
MDVYDEFSEIAVLLGEPARILMLWHLLGGEMRPAGELAFLANVSPQSASMHLSKLANAEMLTVTKMGRNRFYSIASPEVANVVESMAALLPSAKKRANFPKSKRATEFQTARRCYDHLAGKMAIDLTEALQNQNVLSIGQNEFAVTESGEKWFAEFGINIDELKTQRRIFAKKCLDWSERKHHIAGALGAALLQQLFKLKWLAHGSGRTLRLTLDGRRSFEKLFGMTL